MACNELQVAEHAARLAGEVIRKYFREGVTLRTKETLHLVSDADIEAERVIVAAIRESYPDHTFLGEELHAGDPSAQELWIIDPIDGTNNFIHHIPHFAVSIAHYRRGEPDCGVVYNPIREEWYVAERGVGAFANGKQVGVGQQQRLDEVLVGVGFYYDRGAMMEATLAAIADLFRANIHGIRRMGTASLDLAYVGAGLFGAFFEYQLSPWDFAAGRLFVEEAGGAVTTCRNEPLPIARTSVLATNGRLHAAMLEVVQRRMPTADHYPGGTP